MSKSPGEDLVVLLLSSSSMGVSVSETIMLIMLQMSDTSRDSTP
jgi:hypothetical protein